MRVNFKSARKLGTLELTMKIRSLFLGALLILAIVGSIWITSKITIAPYSAGKPDAGPQAYVYDVTIATTNHQGKLVSYFTSPKLIQTNKKNIVEMTQPRITLYSKNDAPKHIRADYGKNNGNKSIVFLGHVVVRQNKQKKQTSIIKTSKLTFYPKKNIAKTNKPVTIIEPTSITHALGLNANLKTGKMVLYGHPAHYQKISENNKPLVTAFANKIIYQPKQHQIELIQNARIEQNGSTITGPHIVYNTKTQTLLSQAQGNRTTILFKPHKKT